MHNFYQMGMMSIVAIAAVAALVSFHKVPETSSDWVKSRQSPVLGGSLGTCFDVCVLKDTAGIGCGFPGGRNQASH